MSEIDTLKTRFDSLFNEGLTNIKFFIHDRQSMTKATFISEVNQFQDAVDRGALDLIENVDKDIKTCKFDEPL